MTQRNQLTRANFLLLQLRFHLGPMELLLAPQQIAPTPVLS